MNKSKKVTIKTTHTTLSIIILKALLLSGCSGLQNASSGNPIQPDPQANIVCDDISLYLYLAIGSCYECVIIPESSGPDMPFYSIHPQYIQVNFKNYPLTETTFTPHIDVFPVQRFDELLPTVLLIRQADLQALISGGSAKNVEMPFLPVLNMAQVLIGKVSMIEFQNGKGVRYLAQYSQGPMPVNNQDMFYTFQGLTTDGHYWISATFPTSSPNLMADAKNPPNGQSWEDFNSDYTSYIPNITAQLNTQNSESFALTINMLDLLINSIVVQ